MAKGWIYILSNPSLKYLKVGQSSKDPQGRASELSQATGVPTPFEIEYSALVDEYQRVERDVHLLLAKNRINPQREFFDCSVREAVEAIKKSVQKIYYEDISNPSAISPRPLPIHAAKPATEEEVLNARRKFSRSMQEYANARYCYPCDSCNTSIEMSFTKGTDLRKQSVVCNCPKCGREAIVPAVKFTPVNR
jgi:hypothetical protein